MLILGLDPASVKFGYGVIRASGSDLTFVDAGVLTAPAAWEKYRRLAEIGRDLEAIFAEHAVDAVALEAEYAPATIKKSITGSGAADKEAVARIVQLRLEMARQPDPDAGDALGAAVCHAHHLPARPAVEAA